MKTFLRYALLPVLLVAFQIFVVAAFPARPGYQRTRILFYGLVSVFVVRFQVRRFRSDRLFRERLEAMKAGR